MTRRLAGSLLLRFATLGAAVAFVTPWFAQQTACGPVTSGAEGISCTTDEDCNPGLKCLPFAYPANNEAGCTASNECLAPCHTDTDCVTWGPGLVCDYMAPCSSTQVCGPSFDAGSDAAPEASTNGGDAGSDGSDASAE